MMHIAHAIVLCTGLAAAADAIPYIGIDAEGNLHVNSTGSVAIVFVDGVNVKAELAGHAQRIAALEQTVHVAGQQLQQLAVAMAQTQAPTTSVPTQAPTTSVPTPAPALHPNALPYHGFVWYTTDEVCDSPCPSLTCDSVCAHYGLTCRENGEGAYTEDPSCGSKNVCTAMFPGASCSADGGMASPGPRTAQAYTSLTPGLTLPPTFCAVACCMSALPRVRPLDAPPQLARSCSLTSPASFRRLASTSRPVCACPPTCVQTGQSTT